MTSMTRVIGAMCASAALAASLSGQSQQAKPEQPPAQPQTRSPSRRRSSAPARITCAWMPIPPVTAARSSG